MLEDPRITLLNRTGDPSPQVQSEYVPLKTKREQLTELWNLGECTCHFGFCPNHPKKVSESA